MDLFRDLQAAGFPEKQAETLIRGMTDKTARHMEPRRNLAELDSKMEKRFADLDTRMLAMAFWIRKSVALQSRPTWPWQGGGYEVCLQ